MSKKQGRIGEIPNGTFDFDIDAREKQVIGDGPKLAPLKLEEIGEDAMAQIHGIQDAFNIPHDTPIPEDVPLPDDDGHRTGRQWHDSRA
jgi:hypothetical protein